MVYVDDLVLMGPKPQSLFEAAMKKVLLKKTGELTEGANVKFLGRRVTLREGVVEIYMNEDYVQQILKEHGLENANSVVPPGLQSVTTPETVSALEEYQIQLDRRGVGKAMWMVPLRPDIYYTTKELARTLQEPTKESMIRLRHLLRYLKGTQHYRFAIYPRVQLSPEVPVELKVAVDSDWAGCRTTRRSTSGCV